MLACVQVLLFRLRVCGDGLGQTEPRPSVWGNWEMGFGGPASLGLGKGCGLGAWGGSG